MGKAVSKYRASTKGIVIPTVIATAVATAAHADLVGPASTDVIPGTSKIARMDLGSGVVSAESYFYPSIAVKQFESGVNGSWVSVQRSIPSLDDALDFSALESLTNSNGWRQDMFIDSQPDDSPEENDNNPELMLVGRFPLGCTVQAYIGGSVDDPIAVGRSVTIEPTAFSTRSVPGLSITTANGDGGVSVIGLDASGDLGLPVGAQITGYRIEIPPGSAGALVKILPIACDGDPDELEASLLGVSLADLGSIGSTRNAQATRWEGGAIQGNFPDAIGQPTYGGTSFSGTEGSPGSPIYNITNPPPPVDPPEDPPVDGDDPSNPQDPNIPPDPDDPNNPQDPNDPADPDDPLDPDDPPILPPGTGVFLPEVHWPSDDPRIPQLDPHSSDGGFPGVPAPSVLVLLGAGARMFVKGRRRSVL